MQRCKLRNSNFEVSAFAFGDMSANYGPPSDRQETIALIRGL